jgi:hypothetical protein
MSSHCQAHPEPSPKKFDVFPTVVGICGVKPTKYVIPDYPYEIIVE